MKHLDLDTARRLCDRHWNPIGFPMFFGEGRPPAGTLPQDEYDRYLRHTLHLVETGAPRSDVLSYLRTVESEYLGLSQPAGDKDAFVDAVLSAAR